ncbi:DUF5115 domain-containing protein [Prevotella sp. PCHR]|uniref:DUF5115 domain-containing protein n=1 Tax=Xylanibacter caecicola TaxID=2736294 RepID=A0ABX2AZE2_9BACT|nr:DUF5115 domain-containing protein [Xylanibacter caecicola]NPE24336.1 DUF5115 domain-containing protein [Xylanibacter caecicola]
MKKTLLYSLAAFVGLTFASCNGDYDDWTAPQGWGQEDAITLPGFSATVVAGNIDLANPGQDVKVFTLSEAALPEGTELNKTRMIITPTGEAVYNLPQTIEVNNDGAVDSTALQTAVVKAYGKRPEARPFKAHIYSDVMANGQALLVDAGEIDINVVPKAPFISKAYYFIGDFNGWTSDVTELVKYKFTHSGVDVYEDPIFTYTVTTTNANQCWKIIPQENIDANNVWAQGVVGTVRDGSTDTEGALVTENPQAGKFAEPGTYVVTLNMLDYTYTVTKVDTYYMVGGVYGWNADAASKLAFYNESGSKASITTQWTGDANLKIWNRDNIGNWDVAWGSVTDGATDAEGDLINSGANAFVCPEKGAYYTLTIDMAAKKYFWTKLDNQEPQAYTTVSLIGGFNNWGGDVDMQQTASHNWYVRHTFNAGTEMKFRSNHDWSSTNWGGKAESLAGMIYAAETGGDNLNVAAGTYDIYFNDITGKFLFVEVK